MIAVVPTISNTWFETTQEQLKKAIGKGYKVKKNLNGEYCKLVLITLKEMGLDIAKARKEKDIDKVIQLITDAKSLKKTYRKSIENANTHIYIER